jgi:hypothetical protein
MQDPIYTKTEIIIDKDTDTLLRKLAKWYNEKMFDKFTAGDFDILPERLDPNQMLRQVITHYTLENCPELFDELLNEAKTKP